LRFEGKIIYATAYRAADKLLASFQVQTSTSQFQISDNQADVVGVDLGVKNLATLSNGETIEGRKHLKKLVV